MLDGLLAGLEVRLVGTLARLEPGNVAGARDVRSGCAVWTTATTITICGSTRGRSVTKVRRAAITPQPALLLFFRSAAEAWRRERRGR